ncbi:MAG: CoA-transferase subunit beta [Candidatus Jordarchaeum sp.]|uniref:CoA-transferase subunit beta n=1 Tax=Candidatus Jordarchaeum sp. TaxID=2823881 RepID=UPI004049DA07
MIASMLAQRTHAPNLLIIFEAGGMGPQIPVLPISVGDSRTFWKAVGASSMHDVMSACQAGYIDYGFLGGAQIDPYGNLNTTCIGNHDLPKVRFPGSGGANDIGSLSNKTIYIMRNQAPRTFVNKVDFITTPGYLTGPGAREKAGLPEGSGPFRVITQLGIFDFEEKTKRMRLISLHPGVTLEQIKENCSFELLIGDNIETTPIPTKEEIKILHELDPQGVSIGK